MLPETRELAAFPQPELFWANRVLFLTGGKYYPSQDFDPSLPANSAAARSFYSVPPYI